MSALKSRDAYRLWAPSYSAETAISFLDEKLAADLSQSLVGKRLLDAGCGIARRLMKAEAAFSVGVDASPEMLVAGSATNVVAADVRALPFAAEEFDIVWCRLVLGHIPDLLPAYRELARVLRPGGRILITDFHADAANAGHRRTFRDAAGILHEVEHHMHDCAAHLDSARRCGFVLVSQRDGIIDENLRPFYARAGRLASYDQDRGLSVVAAFLFQRKH